MRHPRANLQHVTGWAGGLVEEAEPDLSQDQILGRLRAGENFVHTETSRLQVRGGARRALTLAEQAVSDLVAIYPWSRTGAILLAHSATNDKHYAYALSEAGGFALPAVTPTETGSRDDVGWDVADPHPAQGVELFETLFLADTVATNSTRQPLLAAKLVAGSLVVSQVAADLDANAVTGLMRPALLAQFASVLFAFGWEDETVGAAPHIARHSFLGQDPAVSAGWDADAFAIVGAQGEPIRAAVPGRGSLLVAKQQQLFRIYGEPEALEGWQFGIQQLDATVGFGAVNAQSLDHADERWWGIGLDGPWSFDGSKIERLVSARRTSWARIGDLSASFVAHHPRRNAVVFGFEEPTAVVSGQRASRLWLYDITRGGWAPDFTHPSRFWMARVVGQAGTELPTSPTNLTWVSDDPALEYEAITLQWDIADPASQTEVYLAPVGGDEVHVATAAAGASGFRVTGLQRGTVYRARVRHRRGEAVTPFVGPVQAATLGDAAIVLKVGLVPLSNATDIPLVLSQGVDGLVVAGAPGTPQGFGASGAGARTVRWDTSGGATIFTVTVAPAGHPLGDAAAPVVFGTRNGLFLTQRLDSGSFRENQITVINSQGNPGVATTGLRVRYRVAGSGGFLLAAYNPDGMVLSGLEHSRQYEVRLERSNLNVVGEWELLQNLTCYTRLRAPVGGATVTGSPGTPQVTLSLTTPDGRTARDLAIMNADGSFAALYTNVSTLPTDYVSGGGVEGRPDTYWVRMRDTRWPATWQYSPPLVFEIADPTIP